MLCTETVSKSTLELLKKLMNEPSLNGFILVGGTALALQLGHRISIDIDLFSVSPFQSDILANDLRINHSFELDFIAKNTLKGEIQGIKVDCIAHQYPWLQQYTILENIRMASIPDIAAMKLNAIAGDGTRVKDFIDIAFLSSKMSLNQMLNSYAAKYNSNPIMPLKAILYYRDLNFNEPVNMANSKRFIWKDIETQLHKMHKFPDKIFNDE